MAWPQAEGSVSLTAAQLSMLLEGIDRRATCVDHSSANGDPSLICVYLPQNRQRKMMLDSKQFEIEHLWAMLAKLRQQRYGRSSEKLDAEIDQLELTLEDAEVGQAQAEAKNAEQTQPTGQGEQQTSRRPRRPAVRKPLPDHLPREIVVLEPKFTCRCNDPSCRTKIREEVTEVLEKIPSQLKVIRYIRPIYACRACEMVTQAPAPDLPILKGRPGPNLISYIAIAKYYGRTG